MLSKEESLSIVLPVYNEEGNIKNVISDIVFHIRNYIKDFEVIVVNDGSRDGTLRILNQIKSLYPELVIVSHQRNKGYGCAIRKGIELSQKKWLFFIDADSQFQIDDFEKFWENRNYNDFILGYRLVRVDNIYRRCLAKIGNYLGNLFLRVKIKDINCGFKLFKTQDLKNILLISTRGSIYFEILICLLKSKDRKFLQLPVQHYKRKRGEQTGGGLKVIIKNLWEGGKIVRLR